MSSSNSYQSSSARRSPRDFERSRSRSRSSNSSHYQSDQRRSSNSNSNNRRKPHHSSLVATSGYGTKNFIFGKQDKGKWARFLTNLNAEFAAEKISYLNNHAEVLRRKTAPAPPVDLPIPPFLETHAERESRIRDQKRLDDMYKSLAESHRVYADKLETDYATAIGIVLQRVSTAIRTDLTLVIEGEALANQSSEE
eukprot:gene3020-3975_t